MTNKKNHFLFNLEWVDILRELPEEVKYEVYDAIIGYAQSGTLSELKPIAKGVFMFIKKEMDYNEGQYQKTLKARREAGSKGGKSNQTKQTVTKQANANFANQTKQNETKQANVSFVKQNEANSSIYEYDIDNIESREIARERLLKVFFDRPITTESFLKRWETTEEELRRICDEVIEDWSAVSDPHLESDDDDAKRHFLNAVRKKYEILKTKTNENKPSYQSKSRRVRANHPEEPGYGLVN